MPDIFISYSRRDKEFIQKLDQAFKSLQKDVWVDWEDIPPTADWWQEIKDGIDESDNFVFVISPDSVSSEVCGRELNYALENGKRLVPVLFREIKDKDQQKQMNPALSSHNWIYMRGEVEDFDAAFKKLSEAISLDLEHAQMHTRINTRAREWLAKERRNDLLLRGKDLEDAETWLSTSANKEPKPNAHQTEYVFASEKSEKRRQQTITAAISVALIGAVIATIVSLYLFFDAREQRILAQREAEVSSSVALAAGARDALSNDKYDLALSLALQSMEIENPPVLAPQSLIDAAYSPGTRRLFAGHSSWVWGTDYNPNGQTIVSGGEQGELFLWDIETGEIVRRFEGHEGAVNEIVFNADGTRLVSGADDKTVRVWDVETGEELLKIETPSDVWAVAISPDGEKIMSGSIDGKVLLWDANTGEQLDDFTAKDDREGHNGKPLWVIAFSPDGQKALSAGEDNQIIVWDMATATAQYHLTGHTQAIMDGRFSPDGTKIITASRDTSLILWNMETGSQIRRFNGHRSGASAADFSPDGQSIISGGWDNTLILWDAENANIVRQFYGHTGGVTRTIFSPDGQHVISSSYDNNLRLWDIQGALEVLRLSDDTAINSVVYSPDGSQFVSGAIDGHAVLWDAESGEVIRAFEAVLDASITNRAQKDDIDALAFSPDGKYLLMGLYSADVLLWDVESGDLITTFTDHDRRITNVAFSPDGKRALSADEGGIIKLWDVDQTSDGFGQTLVNFNDHRNRADAITFTPDGQHVLSGGHDRTIMLWDAETGEVIREYTGHTDAILDLEFTPDGTHFASSSWDTTARYWNTESGEILGTFTGHISGIHSVSLSEDGTRLLTASEDGSIRLWEIERASEVFRFDGHASAVREVTYSPDGTHFLSGGRDNRVIVWSLPLHPQQLVQWVRENRYVRDLTCDELRNYNLVAECEVSEVGLDIVSLSKIIR